MRTAPLVLVAVLAAAVPTTGCSFAVRGSESASATGGVGPDSDDPKLESPGSTPSTPATPADMTVVSAAPPDLLPPPDLAKPSPPPPPPPSAVGQPCGKDRDCGGNGLVCITHVGGIGIFGADFPGGYCSQTCSNDAPCPSGSSCRTIKLTNVCVAQCPPSACRSGYNCCSSGDNSVCAPANVCGQD